jgi:hypothetical protein
MNFRLNDRLVTIARSLAIIGGTGALIVGATMAATPVGTASLTGNSFTTAAAQGGITIAPDNSGSPGTFAANITGFNFGQLSTGTTPTRSHFWLKNNTNGAVTVTIAAANLSNFANLDQNKAIVHIEKTGTTTADSNSLASLVSGSKTLSNPPASGDANGNEYDIWVTLDSGAVTTGQTTSGSFDLNFTGNTP